MREKKTYLVNQPSPLNFYNFMHPVQIDLGRKWQTTRL